MKVVKLKVPFGSCNPGEVCGLRDRDADALIAAGKATHIADASGNKKPKPSTSFRSSTPEERAGLMRLRQNEIVETEEVSPLDAMTRVMADPAMQAEIKSAQDEAMATKKQSGPPVDKKVGGATVAKGGVVRK